ncbi:MAG TPA: class I SAM-dependent methyltransferase [Patescibacteria group bacterium]|nr:class I SAM-dependent methyltransferase [Patescibacteria group bacterium]
MSYREGAERFYDLFDTKTDAHFYLELAREQGGKALELGVGTARVAIQLAREGIETWGIDRSPYMLNAARANIGMEPREVQERLHIELADVRDFHLEEAFGLIYFPSYSFDHIMEREEQAAALRNIRRHLAPGGVYTFDLAHVPELKPDSGWFVERKTLDEHRLVVRTGYHKTYPERSIMSVNLWYDLTEDGRITERYFDGTDVYIHSPEGIKTLLEMAGFKILNCYGDHERHEFDESSKSMVVVARPV